MKGMGKEGSSGWAFDQFTRIECLLEKLASDTSVYEIFTEVSLRFGQHNFDKRE